MTSMEEALRGAAPSRPKVAHARPEATSFLKGTIGAGRIALLDDKAAIVTIGSIKGLHR